MVPYLLGNEPFLSFPGPLYQNEVKCSAFDKEMIFDCHANETHFDKTGYELGLILKVRVFGTRKWPILNIRSIISYLLARFILYHYTNLLRYIRTNLYRDAIDVEKWKT